MYVPTKNAATVDNKVKRGGPRMFLWTERDSKQHLGRLTAAIIKFTFFSDTNHYTLFLSLPMHARKCDKQLN